MKQNTYDKDSFFSAYKEMPRSVKGLEAAGEWHILKEMFPNLKGKRVLDLGCGFGWHCRYAADADAKSVVGVDLSKKMIEEAVKLTDDDSITYQIEAIEDYAFPKASFEVIISSLAFHYVKDFNLLCKKIYGSLKSGGTFVFSVEHPIFTSRAAQDWHYDEVGNIMHWPVDDYQEEGLRETNFLNEAVTKYHRTLSTYLNDLIEAGFTVKEVEESYPTDEMVRTIPGMQDENRRPMFLLIGVVK